jgi:drug/metabolite transporter (DMT)-like permease
MCTNDTLPASMPLPALLLLLGAAVLHGFWNLMLKREGGRLDVALGALAVGALLATPAFAIYPVNDVPLTGWMLVVLSALFETGYFLALSAAYRVGDLSLVYPLARGTAPVAVAPLAALFLGERPSAHGLLGIALVVTGILASHAGHLRAAVVSPETRRAVGLALVTGLMTTGYSLVNKVGVALVPVPVYSGSVFAANVVMFAVVLRRKGIALPVGRGARWGPMLAIGAAMMTTYMAIMLAMTLAPVSYVVAGREVSIVFGAALGALVLRERHPRSRIAGAAIIFAGLALMAL